MQKRPLGTVIRNNMPGSGSMWISYQLFCTACCTVLPKKKKSSVVASARITQCNTHSSMQSSSCHHKSYGTSWYQGGCTGRPRQQVHCMLEMLGVMWHVKCNLSLKKNCIWTQHADTCRSNELPIWTEGQSLDCPLVTWKYPHQFSVINSPQSYCLVSGASC